MNRFPFTANSVWFHPMPIRRLTRKFIDSLKVPESGEIWIADTVVRGFGLRLWATQSKGGAAYCIRTTDQNGRVVRKTFIPDTVKFVYEDEVVTIRASENRKFVRENGEVRASRKLEEAREWARVEIRRLKGLLPTELEDLHDKEIDQKDRRRLGARIEERTLRFLVEKILEYSICRGWTEKYTDRIRQAFDRFDRMTGAGTLTISELGDGRLVNLIENSQMGPGTLRLVRSALWPVLQNVHDLTSLNIGQILPNDGRGVRTKAPVQHEFIGKLQIEDFKGLFQIVRELPFNWRSRLCIELCFHLQAPIRRVMTGRWSQFSSGHWCQYVPSERKYAHWYRHSLEEPEYDVLAAARNEIVREELETDYWFPRLGNPDLPISNVDRAWSALMRQLRWPKLSMAHCCNAYRHIRPFPVRLWSSSAGPAYQRWKEIHREVSDWDQPYRR